ncbi:MAG: hypothetical protein JW893_06435 [Candidatus Omnitrophica bacterium]|nr:hypothetical protein [Candidatus Omnitrophota bacterium]
MLKTTRSLGGLLLCLTCSFLSLQAEEAVDLPRVDGIVYDADTPANSAAIIDETPLGVGDQIKGFRITEIQRKLVFLEDETTGETVTLEITGGRKEPEKPAEIPQVEIVEETTVQPLSAMETLQYYWRELWIRLFPEKETAGPQGIPEQAKKVARQVFNAGLQYYLDESRQPSDIQVLISAGYLKYDFDRAVKDAYRFYFDKDKKKPGVHADPLGPEAVYPYYFLDRAYRMHVSPDGPATAESPIDSGEF